MSAIFVGVSSGQATGKEGRLSRNSPVTKKRPAR